MKIPQIPTISFFDGLDRAIPNRPDRPTTPPRRPCTATTKAGNPCTAWAALGEAQCLMHGTQADAVRKLAVERSAAVRTQRVAERRKTFSERLAEQLEARADEILGAALDAAAAGDWRAMAWCIERVHGKAPDRVEVGVGALADLRSLTQQQLDERQAQLMALLPALEAG